MKNLISITLVFLISVSVFSQTGNVGVGNTTPVAKLDVAGDLALREGTAIAVSGANPAVTLTLHATNAENSFYRITGSPTGIMTLNSIANGVDGQIIALVNATSIKLNITDNNVANGIRTPTGSPVAIPTNGSVTLQYAATPTARWYITSASSGGVLPDWVKANTANDPAGTLDSQYVNAKIGIGDFKNGATGGSDLEGWVTIKTPTDGTPSIVNPIKDAGIVIQGEGGTPSIKSRFRLVSNNNGWSDNKPTSYLQISNNATSSYDKSNLTLMSGSSGHDVTFNRFQINSDSTQITDYDFGTTPKPSSVFEVISGRNVAKNIFQIKGIAAQTGNFFDITSNGGSRGDIMTVKSNGNVGVGNTSPLGPLSIGDASVANSDGFLVIGKKSGSSTRQMRLGFDASFNFVIGDYGNSNTAGTWTSPFSVNYNAPNNSLNIISSGYVGIGESVPNSPLHIGTGTSVAWPSGYTTYASQGTTSWTNAALTANRSIYARWAIHTSTNFVMQSDARTKNIIELSDSKKDLDIINKIEVTDYIKIDDINQQVQKKFIAQQLLKVYPRVVSSAPGFIPNTYRIPVTGTTTSGPAQTIIEMKTPHGFKVGDVVRIMERDRIDTTKVGGEYELMVEATDGTNCFVVNKAFDKNIIVYGKKVNDLLEVDYDAIFALNVSATQELAKRNAALECEVEALKAENAQLKYSKADAKDVDELKAQIQELKTLILNTGLKAER